eukprot:1741313-Rhodomonas_salina.1
MAAVWERCCTFMDTITSLTSTITSLTSTITSLTSTITSLATASTNFRTLITSLVTPRDTINRANHLTIGCTVPQHLEDEAREARDEYHAELA